MMSHFAQAGSHSLHASRCAAVIPTHTSERFPLAAVLLLLVAVFSSTIATDTAGQIVVAPGNLDISGQVVSLHDGTLSVVRSEVAEGVDLTGDGDQNDSIPHFAILPSAEAITLPWALGGLQTVIDGGRWLVVVRHEFLTGSDLNGNGTTTDSVVVVVDRRTGQQMLAGATVLGGVNLLADGLLMVRHPELGVDLNGDGDIGFDVVPHLHDLHSGVVSNLGVGGIFEHRSPDGEFIVGLVFETMEQVDLNGDGLIQDVVAHVYEVASGQLRNVGLVGRLMALPATDGSGAASFAAGRTLFETGEADLGQDIDGDGQLDARVVTLLDPATATVQATTLTFPAGTALAAPQIITFIGDHILLDFPKGFLPFATRQLFLIDARDGTVTDLGLDLGSVSVAPSPLHPIPSFGDVAALLVEESSSAGPGTGSGDLNGDGDLDDRVLHLLRVTDGKLLNTGLAGEWLASGGQALVVTVLESAQGGLDRNGDGDVSDQTVVVVDFSTGTVHALPLAIGSIPVTDGKQVAILVDEAAQGAIDLNGDGDSFDDVLHVLDLRTGLIERLGSAVASGPIGGTSTDLFVADGRVAFQVREQEAGGIDLNGDGDVNDVLVHATKP